MPRNISAKRAPANGRKPSKFEHIRWSNNRAAIEFGCDHGFLSRRLKACGIIPAEDGYYSTLEICEAVYGDIDTERTRKVSEDADRSAMVNAQLRRELVTKKNALAFITGVASTIRARIAGSDLQDHEKDACYEDLRICFHEKEVSKALFEDTKVIGSDDEPEEIEEESPAE